MNYTETLSTTEPLRPQFFVTRQNGTMIPLIAADELPSTISIRGVPRLFSPHDISGMIGIGTFNSRDRQYVVEDMSTARGIQPLHPLHEAPTKSLHSSTFAPPGYRVDQGLFRSNHESLASALPRTFGIEEQPSSSAKTRPRATADPAELGSTASLPSFHHNASDLPIHHSTGVKEYCSFWLRRGECDYAQQGCLYKHEMPLDRPTLERLGYRDIPRWYREKHGLGSHLAGANTNPISPVKTCLMGKSWRRCPVEVLLEDSQKEAQKLKSVSCTTSSRNNINDDHAILTGSLSLRPKNEVNVAPSLPKQDNSLPNSHVKLENPPIQPVVFQTIAQQQPNPAMLPIDEFERNERERINERYRVLTAQAPSGISAPANTPSSSTASSINGESTQEFVFPAPGTIVQPAQQLVNSKPASLKPVVNYMAKAARVLPPPPVNAFPRVAMVPGVGKKRMRMRQRRRARESGTGLQNGGDVKEKVGVESLVEHE